MLVAYVDAASDRITRKHQLEHVELVEAVRMGTIFAHHQRQYERWRRSMDRTIGRVQGAVGAALEAQVRSLAMTNPEYVVTDA